MTVYNLRTSADPGAYTITKWNAFGNHEATYQLTQAECTCPAGHRHTCRHRQMLPDLLPIIDTEYFLDYAPERASIVVDINGVLHFEEPEGLDELDIAEMRDGVEKDNHSAPATQPSHPWRRI